ncbi:MAG TPA: hexose kinase [Candidatus Merdivicinus excrementipullorum]|uniref:Tagatose-6-phosphate kinase n=1 Tax=Candidatus Merdivicinus excrementipullorum TaxID=2840867 RepID=A0A9D1FNR8_9FIRM|nr:hexose kinase [Candidatus Merdivicinus excrementipullorum]
MFDKIVTISLNPALDVTIWLTTMDFAEPNQAAREEIFAGGKSVNISRVMTSLGMPAKALGLCGKENAGRFLKLLEQDGVSNDFVRLEGSTRENLTIVIPDKRVLKINRAGFPVSIEGMKQLRAKVEEEIQGNGKILLVFAGSLPANLTPESYKAFLLSFRREGVCFALDNSFFHLSDIAEIRPFLIKPNLLEFRQMSGSDLRTEQSIVKLARSLTAHVDHVLVSLGAKGMIYAGQDSGCRIYSPQVPVRSTVGAGDTSLAAFLCALQRGMAPCDAAVYGAAAGTASVMLDGTGIVSGKMIDSILPQMTSKGIR